MVKRVASLLMVLLSGCATRRSAGSANVAAPPLASCQSNPSSDTTVFDTTQVSRRPEVLSGPSLSYPDELRRRRISGRVVLSVVINAAGSLEPHSIERVRSDDPAFEESALGYLREAVFAPG